MDFFVERTPKAAKAHRCDACRQTIEPGTTYTHMAMKWDGEVETVKQHAECRAAEIALARLHDLHGGEDWIHLNDLQEPDDLFWLREHHPVVFGRLERQYSSWLEAEDA